MAGEAGLDELVAFLSRLTGTALTADEPAQLRSVQRAALSAWSREHGVPIRFALLASGTPFRVRDLLQPEDLAAGAEPVTLKTLPLQFAGTASPSPGVGIDIEDVAALPVAADYREHPFYRSNFTPAEIAHCIRQADERASLCGLWAAKEAILKCGLGVAPTGQLSGIEIRWDGLGRPIVANGQLSISHTATAAVAVCIAAGVSVPPAQVEDAPAAMTLDSPVGRRRGSPARAALAACLALILASGALSLALHAWR